MQNTILNYMNGKVDYGTGVFKELPPVMHQKHFTKFFLNLFIPVLSDLEGKQVKVLAYILQMMKPGDNLFIDTYSKIEKNLGLSHQTVVKAMSVLKQKDFIRPISNGQWMVNPNIVCKGNDNKRYMLHLEYYKLEDPSNKNK